MNIDSDCFRSCFPFEKLPLELRQAIYKLVFRTGEDVSIDSRLFRDMGDRQTLASKYRTPVIVSPRNAPRYSLVLANHMISEEATEFLYSGRHFVFGTTANLKNWLKMIGDCAKFVTSLEVRRTGAQQTSHVYLQLSAATNLRYLCITLPLSPSSDTLDVHIDKHWSHLKHFLLASYASEAKAMARLDAIHFRVGKEQGGVLGSDGKPMRAITSAKNAWCRERIRGHLRKHFAHAK